MCTPMGAATLSNVAAKPLMLEGRKDGTRDSELEGEQRQETGQMT